VTSIKNSSYVERIAIVKPDALGDFVLLSTSLKYLRAIRPESHITLFISEELLGYAHSCPYANQVVGIFSQADRSFDSVMGKTTAYLERSPAPFDKVILVRWDIDYYFASHLCARLPSASRHAYSEQVTLQKSIMNKGFDRFFTHHYNANQAEHEHTKNLKLIGLVFKDQVNESWFQARTLSWFGIADELWMQQLLSTLLIPYHGQPIIVISPEASEENRMLSIDSWVRIEKIAQEVFKSINPYYFIVGTKKYAQLCSQLSLIFKQSVNLCGSTSISNLSKLLSTAKVLFAMDSGVSHLASSFETSIIQFRCSTDDVNPYSAKSKHRFRPVNDEVRCIEPINLGNPCVGGYCQSHLSHCINNFSDENLLHQMIEVAR
jgi:ADP-heptose:LPS heptosyltransferase